MSVIWQLSLETVMSRLATNEQKRCIRQEHDCAAIFDPSKLDRESDPLASCRSDTNQNAESLRIRAGFTVDYGISLPSRKTENELIPSSCSKSTSCFLAVRYAGCTYLLNKSLAEQSRSIHQILFDPSFPQKCYIWRRAALLKDYGMVELIPVLIGGTVGSSNISSHADRPATLTITEPETEDTVETGVNRVAYGPDRIRELLRLCKSQTVRMCAIASTASASRHILAKAEDGSRPEFASRSEFSCPPAFPVVTPFKIKPLTNEDDDEELAKDLFQQICGSGNGVVDDACDHGSGAFLSLEMLRESTRRRPSVKERAFLEALDDIVSNKFRPAAPGCNPSPQSDDTSSKPSSSTHDTKISFAEFLEAFRAVPRVRGERLRWAGSLGIDAALAQLLRKGDAFDGLRGLRSMNADEVQAHVQEVCTRLSAALPGLLLEGLEKLHDVTAAAPAPNVRVRANAKFVADGPTVGRFATLDDFYRGPEALIGVPNPRIWDGMLKEHCSRDNAKTPFTSTNYNVETWSHQEWDIVVCPEPGKAYPHTPTDKALWPADCKWWGAHGRDVIGVDELMQQPKVSEMKELVGLLREEVVGLRLYTGPMFVLYNAALRRLPQKDFECLLGNRYETTIFVIASGITKLSKATQVPSVRLLYRGLSGDLVLPDQFWNAHAECTVTLTVRAGGEKAALAAACALAARVETDDSAPVAAASWGAVRGGRLVLPAVQKPAGPSTGEVLSALNTRAGDNQVEAGVVLPADISGNDVRLVVVLPGTRRVLEAGKLDRFVAAVQACCAGGRPDRAPEVHVEEVAEKPQGFRGGVELGLLSLSESRSTALRYGGDSCGRLGTLLEVQVGRVDIGASIGFLSQYPGEQEYLMPPLCCLEVVGEPRLDRTEDSYEVVIVPMRVNVNLKSSSVEDLIGRRKLLHAAATKNLREELARRAEDEVESFAKLLAGRRCGKLELLRGVRENVTQQTAGDGPETITFVGRTWTTMWAPYLTVSTGRVFFEVEVETAEGTLGAGFAGTRYSSTIGADVGDDEISWAIFSFDKARHSNCAKKLDAAAGWFKPGAVLGVAIDVEAGRMMTAVWRPGENENGAPLGCSKWEEVYDSGVAPSGAVGGGLFPILTGGWGASGVCNFGHYPNSLRHSPPESDYVPLANVIKEELVALSRAPVTSRGTSSYVKEAEEILGMLNVGKTALLRGFDVVKHHHENMAADEYNNDAVYRDSLNDILSAKFCAEQKQAVVVELLDAGAAPAHLNVVRDAPAADFHNIAPGALGAECVGYSWRLIFSGWFRFVNTVMIPIETAPSLIALVFRAVLDAGPCVADHAEGVLMTEGDGIETRSVVVGKRTVTVSSLIPVLRLQKTMLHAQRFENALLGLVLIACQSENSSRHPHHTLARTNTAKQGLALSESATNTLTDADFRGLEYSRERTLQLASAIVIGHVSGHLRHVNALEVKQPATGQNLRDFIRRSSNRPSTGIHFLERQTSVINLGDRLDWIDWCFVMAEAALGNWNVLNLSHDGLGPVAATGLAAGLPYVLSLTALDLSHNCLQSQGAAAIGSALTALTLLSKLELENNSLGPLGATALGKHLPKLSHLRELGLAGNEISAAGASSICQALSASFTRLARLDLSTNALGQAGGEAVAAMLHSLPSLTFLGLGGQDVCSAVWHVLAGLVPRATSLAVDSGLVTMVCMPVNAGIIPNPVDGQKTLDSTVELHRRHSLGPDGSRRLSTILKASRCVSAARLTSLELSYNGILAEGATALAPALAGLSALTRLGLNSNSLGPAGARAISDGLRWLLNLKCLSLEGNDIGAAGWATLAEAMKGLTSLVSLNGCDEYGNLLAGDVAALEVSGKELAAAVAHLLQRSATTLSVLDVSSNCLDSNSSADRELTSAPAEACRMIESFGAIVSLTSLRLCDNMLGKAGGEALSRALCCLDCLTSLDLARVELGPDGAAALSKGLMRLTMLRALGISGNRVGNASVSALCDALPNPGVLASLDIGGNDLGVAGATALANRMSAISRLETLKAADNNIGGGGSVALGDGLARLGQLTCLDLRGNGLGPTGIEEIFRSLVRTPEKFKSIELQDSAISVALIRYLDLRENGLGEEGGSICAAGIAWLTTLESLVLAGNALRLAGCQEVLAALAHSDVLREIDLSENYLGPESGEDIGERLGSLCLLESVYLEGNRLGPRGVAAIVQGLARLTCLRSLGINDNQLGPEGGTELGRSLSRLTSLEVLELEGNALGPDGGIAVAQGAVLLLSLRELSLRDNALGPDASRKIAALLSSSEIIKVDLLWNDLVRKGGGTSTRQNATHNFKGLLASTASAAVMRDRRVSIGHRQAAIRGSLHKLGLNKSPNDEAGWRERLCFVAGGKLLYESAKKKGEPELVAELTAIKSIERLFDVGPPGFYLFCVDKEGSDRPSTFAANSAQERDRWISTLLRLREMYQAGNQGDAQTPLCSPIPNSPLSSPSPFSLPTSEFSRVLSAEKVLVHEATL